MMSDDGRAAKIQHLNSALDFVTKHFAVLSVLFAVAGATLAIIFIAAYLRVFDWRVIWVIEYADVLKIGLVVVAILSSFAWYVWSSARDAIDLANQRGKSWLVVWSFGFVLWCLSLGSFLWTDYHSAEPYYMLHVFMHLAIFAIIALVLLIINFSRQFPAFDGKAIAWIMFGIVANVSTLGTAFGYYTRDTEGFRHDVYLKDKELHDVGLVLLTSHHVVVYAKDKTVMILPASDVARIERRQDAKK